MKQKASQEFRKQTRKATTLPYLIPVEHLHDMAVSIAEQVAMQGAVKLLSHGTRMYDIAESWQSRQLRDVSAVCDTATCLEKSMRDPKITHIFLEKAALITDGDIEKITRRNAAPKVLFREVGTP